eukprot:CAMPEP_0176318454 /NCGR_PEP_ID=MMETSP0121_2-20121125/69787_1 /TAXON_ID=160619 /ORGANISM="Kryptoperidinium foliaceum, Strain CCMP 1326" /LENGTH=101 /DNA_ID=CAMNT_0017660757 /DNA_START=277 /DNA_END=578 /DNA_ORIENTATION=-
MGGSRQGCGALGACAAAEALCSQRLPGGACAPAGAQTRLLTECSAASAASATIASKRLSIEARRDRNNASVPGTHAAPSPLCRSGNAERHTAAVSSDRGSS